MDELTTRRYLQRHYVAWLLQGQWQPELSLPRELYQAQGQRVVMQWRFLTSCPCAAWATVEGLIHDACAPFCEAWVVCQQNQAVALFSASSLDQLPDQVMLWMVATLTSEALERIGYSVELCELSSVCGDFCELPNRTMTELSAWWSEHSSISPQQRRAHRKRIQNHIKKGQYGHVAGYVLRCIRQNRDASFWSWIPLLTESVCIGQSPSMELLLVHFNMESMRQEGLSAFALWMRKTLVEIKAVSERIDPIARVCQSIEADCSLPYQLENLTESLGLSTAYFSRLFKQRMGMCFSDYLTQQRIEHARALLREHRSLSEVSQACGFQRKSYFCTVFRKITGMTAMQYQNKEEHAQ